MSAAGHGCAWARPPSAAHGARAEPLPRRTIVLSLTILGALMFSKSVYLASINSYLQFYLIDKFQLNVPSAQTYLFLFLAAVAAGTFGGGPLGDRFGRKYVIWFSILGVFPFTMLLPYANLFWTGVLLVLIGLILASAFSVILVYAQELLPGKVGLIAGLFFGLAFGLGGLGAAGARRAGRSYEHPLRLFDLRLAARDRIAGGLPAQFAQNAAVAATERAAASGCVRALAVL